MDTSNGSAVLRCTRVHWVLHELKWFSIDLHTKISVLSEQTRFKSGIVIFARGVT